MAAGIDKMEDIETQVISFIVYLKETYILAKNKLQTQERKVVKIKEVRLRLAY